MPYNYTVDAAFNVTYFDQNDTSITNLSDSWMKPTDFVSSYPDSTRVVLSGYVTGPGVSYSAVFPDSKGTLDWNTFSQVDLVFSVPDFNPSQASIIFLQADPLEDQSGNTAFSLFLQDRLFEEDGLALFWFHCSPFQKGDKTTQITCVNI